LPLLRNTISAVNCRCFLQVIEDLFSNALMSLVTPEVNLFIKEIQRYREVHGIGRPVAGPSAFGMVQHRTAIKLQD